MSGEIQRVETAGALGYNLATPEFFHLLQRIEQTESVLRLEIKAVEHKIEQKLEQTESALRQEIKQETASLRQEISTLRQEVKQELAGVRTLIWATLALVTGTLGLTVTVVMR